MRRVIGPRVSVILVFLTVLCTASAAVAGTSPAWNREHLEEGERIAKKYAPRLALETFKDIDLEEVIPLPWNFDGDDDGLNNFESIRARDLSEITPAGYYDVIFTPQEYYISYFFFFPREPQEAAGHENDNLWFYLVVDRKAEEQHPEANNLALVIISADPKMSFYYPEQVRMDEVTHPYFVSYERNFEPGLMPLEPSSVSAALRDEFGVRTSVDLIFTDDQAFIGGDESSALGAYQLLPYRETFWRTFFVGAHSKERDRCELMYKKHFGMNEVCRKSTWLARVGYRFVNDNNASWLGKLKDLSSYAAHAKRDSWKASNDEYRGWYFDPAAHLGPHFKHRTYTEPESIEEEEKYVYNPYLSEEYILDN